MPFIPFGEWLPDQSKYGLQGVTDAKNVLPSATGYLPLPNHSPLTDALTERPLGAQQGVDNSLDVYQYAGDASKLYENIDNAWTDRSKSGGYNTGDEEVWEFAQWKNKMLATNWNENPQQITFGGTQFSDLTTDFRARHVAVIRDFVVFGNTQDSSDGAVPDRVRWSAIDDETDYTVSASTLSDFQDLKTGEVKRIVAASEFGLVFQKDSVWRMTFVGSPSVFQFDKLGTIGAIASGGVISYGDGTVFFWSGRGFYELVSGTEIRPIGSDRVDEFALNDLDFDYLSNVRTAVDKKRVYWAYPGAGNTNGRPNKILVYDRTLGRWSIIEKEINLIWSASGTGQSLDQLDNINSSIDALEFSLDSSAWKGGDAVNLAAFDADKKHGFFDASTNLTGMVKTAEYEFTPGRQTHLTSFRPVVEGGTVTAKVGTRDDQADAISYTASLSPRTSGRITTRQNARFHTFEITASGDFEHMIGVRVEQQDIRPGGRRGV